jgi:protein TonB
VGAAAGLIWIFQQAPTPLGVVEIAVDLGGTSQSSNADGAGDLATASDSAAAEQASPADVVPSEAPEPRPVEQTSEEVSVPDAPVAEKADTILLPQPIQPQQSEPPAPKKVRPRRQPKVSSTRARDEQRERRIAAGRGERADATSTGGSGRTAGSAEAGGMSRASYAALVLAQIQARKFYPPSARAGGAVGFSLAIGPSGSVTQFRITRSSGSDVLDQAARQIVTSIHPPPPPRGSFSGAATLRFDALR